MVMVSVKLARCFTREAREKTNNFYGVRLSRSLRTKDILKDFRCLCVYTAVDHVVAVWWVQLHFVKRSTRKVERRRVINQERGTIKTALNQPGVAGDILGLMVSYIYSNFL